MFIFIINQHSDELMLADRRLEVEKGKKISGGARFYAFDKWHS